MIVGSSGDGLSDTEYQGQSISLYIWHAGTWTVKLDGKEGYRVLPVLASERQQRRSSLHTHTHKHKHSLTHTCMANGGSREVVPEEFFGFCQLFLTKIGQQEFLGPKGGHATSENISRVL